MEPKQTGNLLTIPGAIIIAAAIIAIAIIWTLKPKNAPSVIAPVETDGLIISVAPITVADHILGNPDAPIKIVEYSDPSCPYCKTFHPTMIKLINKYGADGKVAWVYRSFPIDKQGTRPDGGILHVNAGREAQSFECAASLGGNEKFWAYAQKFYETTPAVSNITPDGLDQKKIPDIAKAVGLDAKKFTECLDSGKFKDKVEAQYVSGVNAGVNGTPTSFFVLNTPANTYVENFIKNTVLQYHFQSGILELSADKKVILMGGALPIDIISKMLDTILVNSK